MQPAVLIRLRPLGPWRYGPGDGGLDRVDLLYRSDRLYSAVTLAMGQLGLLDSWLEATAHGSKPAVSFTSLFPFQGDTLFVAPPSILWPPPAPRVTTPSAVFLTKVRWSAARFVPVSLVESLLTGQSILADQWIPDAESGCLLRRDRPSSSPFRTAIRSGAAVDRLTQNHASVHTSACIEFEAGSGLWAVTRFASDAAHAEWNHKLKAAFRLLTDTGFGGRRSSGWGQTEEPEIREGTWPALLMPKLGRIAARSNQDNGHDTNGSSLYWLLSLFSPSSADAVDWKAGDYEVTVRGGRVDGAAGRGGEKKRIRMISEGSVLAARAELTGAAIDVAPEGCAHPVFRSGFAVALKLPPIPEPSAPEVVEALGDLEALEEKPCEPEAVEAGEHEAALEIAAPESPAEISEPVQPEGSATEAVEEEQPAPAEPAEEPLASDTAEKKEAEEPRESSDEI
jgi:CRISPR type III-A-associated RAMP protein Csm4